MEISGLFCCRRIDSLGFISFFDSLASLVLLWLGLFVGGEGSLGACGSTFGLIVELLLIVEGDVCIGVHEGPDFIDG